MFSFIPFSKFYINNKDDEYDELESSDNEMEIEEKPKQTLEEIKETEESVRQRYNKIIQQEKIKSLLKIQQIKKDFDSIVFRYPKQIILNNAKQYVETNKILNQCIERICREGQNIDYEHLMLSEKVLTKLFEKLLESLNDEKNKMTQEIGEENKNKKEDVNMTEEDEKWIFCSSYQYYENNNLNNYGTMVVYYNNNKTLIRFCFNFSDNYQNQFKTEIVKDYKKVNQYFDIHKLDQIWNSEKLEYVKPLDNNTISLQNKLINNAIEYLKFMIDHNEDFKSFINSQPNMIKKGIEEVQRFINITLENYSDVHDFKFYFKKLFIGYLKHEYVDKNSLDFLLIYAPLNDLKKIYNDPKIWVIKNFDFGF